MQACLIYFLKKEHRCLRSDGSSFLGERKIKENASSQNGKRHFSSD
jgi:hypothetical protein